MIYFLVALALTLSSRAIYAWRVKSRASVTDGDAIGHLTFVKEFKRNGGARIDLTNRYILEGGDYPNGFHWLFFFLRFPVRWLEAMGGFLPLLFDAMLLCVAYFAIIHFGGDEVIWLLFFPFLRAFWENEGRAAHFNERAFGGLCGNIFLLSTVGFYLEAGWAWGLAALLSFLALSVSSKFTWQAVAFHCGLLSIFAGSWFFLIAFVASAFFSFICTLGYSWDVLKGLVRFSHFYSTYLAKRYPGLKRQWYMELFSLLRFGSSKIFSIVFTNPPLKLITNVPLTLVAFIPIWYALSYNVWHHWILVSVFLLLLISTTSFKFLGEPERYLEYAIIPIFIVLSFFPPNEHILFTSLAIAVSIIVLLFELLKNRFKESNQYRGEDLRELRNWIGDQSTQTILTIPFRVSFFLGYETGDHHRYLTLFSSIGKGDSSLDYKWLIKDWYPFVRNNINAVIDRFGVNLVVVDKESVKNLERFIDDSYYSFDEFATLYENSTFRVFRGHIEA